MSLVVQAALSALGLFLGMLALLELGRRVGAAHRAREAGESPVAVEGAVFGLLGLLIGFTFSGATSRFDDRRKLVAEEANAIGTAYLRLDLLPPEAQPALREKFRRYVDLRLETYRKLPDIEAAKAALARSVTLQGEIWADAVAASRAGEPHLAALLVLPALNEMIDVTTTRLAATQMHPPRFIFVMLWGIALVTAFLAGYAMAGAKQRNALHMLIYAFVVAASCYVIVDLEYPRTGLIRVDAIDQLLVEVRRSMT